MLPHLILIFSVLCLSQAGNLIRLCSTDAMTITFYRLAIALVLMLPAAIPVVRRTLPKVNRRLMLTLLVMSVTFSSHFFAWILAVQKTKVGNAAICFSLSPIFTALGARYFLKENVGRSIIVAIVTGLAGIAVVSRGDFSLSPEYFAGDLLAVLSGFLFSIHCLLGKTVRDQAPNLFIMTVVFFFGAILSLPILLGTGAPLSGFDLRTNIGLVSLAVFPTILGHASLIYLMKYFSASTVSTVLLLEPVLAGLVAFLAFGERLTFWSFVGYVLITVGLLPLIYDQAPSRKKIEKVDYSLSSAKT